MAKYKKGVTIMDKATGRRLILTSRRTGNNHWNTKRIKGGKAHSLNEGTMDKFYEVVK